MTESPANRPAGPKSQTELSESEFIIYGVPLDAVHDERQGPILEMNSEYPFFGVIYCGFRSHLVEVRRPTRRLWYFLKSEISRSGEVDDFLWDHEQGIHVRYYEAPLTLEIYEKSFSAVNLAVELEQRPRVFAEEVAVPPSRSSAVDIEALRRASPEYLEGTATQTAMEPPPVVLEPDGGGTGGLGGGGLRNCTRFAMTYKTTRYDPWVRRDPVAGDCFDD
jgi:hypothetical protein